MCTAWKRCIRMIIKSPWGLPCQSIVCVSRTFCSHRRGHQHVYKGCEYAHTFSHFETSFLCKFEVASHLRRRKAIMTATSWCLLIELSSDDSANSKLRVCVCHNKSLRGNVIQICSSLQINFYNLHKGVWRIKYSKYNNNNIVATKEVSLKSASKKRNPLVIVLLFHGVCNIKIELNLTNSPLKIASLQKCLLFIFPNPH